jgi:hypothetical protein
MRTLWGRMIYGITDVIRRLDQILEKQAESMSALSNLNDNITALQAEWAKFLVDLQSVLSQPNTDIAVQQAADLVATQTAAIAAEDTTIKPVA